MLNPIVHVRRFHEAPDMSSLNSAEAKLAEEALGKISVGEWRADKQSR
jgi:hypothetical protein